MRMTKHIESIVPRVPVRDADRAPAARSVDRQPVGAALIPVREMPGLAPSERVAELRLRVQRGVYGQRAVVEQVARAMVSRRGPSW
jgi:hypothetical protein